MYQIEFFDGLASMTKFLNEESIKQDRIVFINYDADKLFPCQLVYLTK